MNFAELLRAKYKYNLSDFKNGFSFCCISGTTGPKLKKFWKSVIHNNMNPLSKFKKNRSLTRAQDLTDRRGLTQKGLFFANQ
jgi:hypothetical protein